MIAARVRRNDEAISQQRELHQLAMQRERLQIRALEEQIAKQADANAAKIEREIEREREVATHIFYSTKMNLFILSTFDDFVLFIRLCVFFCIFSCTNCGYAMKTNCICSACNMNKKCIKPD